MKKIILIVIIIPPLIGTLSLLINFLCFEKFILSIRIFFLLKRNLICRMQQTQLKFVKYN